MLSRYHIVYLVDIEHPLVSGGTEEQYKYVPLTSKPELIDG